MKRTLFLVIVLVFVFTSVFALSLGKVKCWYLIESQQQQILIKAGGCVPICIENTTLDPVLYQKLVLLYQEAVAKKASANFLLVLQTLIAQCNTGQSAIAYSLYSQYSYTHVFSDKLDNWAFYRFGENQSWKHITVTGKRNLYLVQKGSQSIEAEKIIEIPEALRGKAIVISANLIANVKSTSANPNKDFAAAGIIANLYDTNYSAYSEIPPTYGKVEFWTTSEYAMKFAPSIYPQQEIELMTAPLNTPTNTRFIFWPDKTANVKFLKIGLIAFANGLPEEVSAELWVSDISVTFSDAVYK